MDMVIKIPKEMYKWVYDNKFSNDYGMGDFIDLIKNGTPIPKGTRLIDVGQCDRELFYRQCGGADSLVTVKSAFDMLLSLPPIIEADKESEEQK